MFVVDDTSGYIKGYFDGERIRQVRERVDRSESPAIHNAAAAWTKAGAIVRDLSLDQYDFVPWKVDVRSDSESEPPDRRGRAFVEYQVRPFGYDSFGNGNRLSMVLDVRDGRLISFANTQGWTYQRPATQIGEASAISAARAVATRFVPRVGNGAASLVKQFVVPDGTFGSVLGAALRQAKVARLAFCVFFSDCVIRIDCETGECLGGGVIGGGESMRTEFTAPVSVRNAVSRWLAGVGLPSLEKWDRQAVEARSGGKVYQAFLVSGNSTSEITVDGATLKVTYAAINSRHRNPLCPPTGVSSLARARAFVSTLGSRLGFPHGSTVDVAVIAAGKNAYPKWTSGGSLVRAKLKAPAARKGALSGATVLLDAKTGQIVSWQAAIKR